LFGPTKFTETEVNEIVGIAPPSADFVPNQGTFEKYLHSEKCLSFGCIPAHDVSIVWFVQYDVKHFSLNDENKEVFRKETLNLMRNAPEKIKKIIEANNFENTYLWKTKDFDLLKSFHKNNVVLIGDAAHLAVPFTSAGTTNAIIDAKLLCECLCEFAQAENAFESFYRLRKYDVNKHLQEGRNLKKKYSSTNPATEKRWYLLLPIQIRDTKCKTVISCTFYILRILFALLAGSFNPS